MKYLTDSLLPGSPPIPLTFPPTPPLATTLKKDLSSPGSAFSFLLFLYTNYFWFISPTIMATDSKRADA